MQDALTEHAHQVLAEWAYKNGHKPCGEVCECGVEIGGNEFAHWQEKRLAALVEAGCHPFVAGR